MAENLTENRCCCFGEDGGTSTSSPQGFVFKLITQTHIVDTRVQLSVTGTYLLVMGTVPLPVMMRAAVGASRRPVCCL